MPHVARSQDLGRQAEDAAAQWLQTQGWQVLARNVRVGHAEIDIVARCQDIIAVVEVRLRGPTSWAGPLDSVDARKRELLRQAARRLWSTTWSADASIRVVRFDVMAVRINARGQAEVERFEGAFQ